jgi:cytoskeletal protein RodZ
MRLDAAVDGRKGDARMTERQTPTGQPPDYYQQPASSGAPSAQTPEYSRPPEPTRSSFDWTWVVVALLVVLGLLGAVWLYNYGQAQQAEAYNDALSETSQSFQDSADGIQQSVSDLQTSIEGIGPDTSGAAETPEASTAEAPAAEAPASESGGEEAQSGE